MKIPKKIKVIIVAAFVAVSGYVIYENVPNPFTVNKFNYYSSCFYNQTGIKYGEYYFSPEYTAMYKLTEKIIDKYQFNANIDLQNMTVKSNSGECKFIVLPNEGELILTESDEWYITSRVADTITIPNLYQQGVDEGFGQVRIINTYKLKIKDPNNLHYAIPTKAVENLELID